MAGRLGRPDQHLDPVDAGHGGGVRHPAPQLQGLGEVAEGLAGGEHGGGVVGRPDQRRQPAGQVVAGQAVPGQLGRRGRGVVAEGSAVGQQPRVGGVQAGPLARQQVAVDGLLEQGVAEPVALGGGAGHQHLPGDGVAQPPLDLGLGPAGGRDQQLVADPAAGHRGHLEDLLGQVGEALDAAEEHVGQGVGQGDVGPDGAGRDQLLGEERVALGTGQDPVDHGRRDRLAGDGLEVLGQLGPAEGGELDPLQVGEADQLGQQRPQGMAAVQLVGAVAGHQGDPAPAQGPDQEGQQVAGGAVGPVEVLDHQQQRGQLGQADQQRQHPVEQLDPLEAVPGRRRRPLVGGQLGQQPAEAGDGRGQRGRDLGLAPGGCRGRGRRRRRAHRGGRRRRPPCSRRPAP